MIEFKKQLKTWEEHVNRQSELSQWFRPCGIACPECGEELLVDTMIVLTSLPPQREYHCEKCNWSGTA